MRVLVLILTLLMLPQTSIAQQGLLNVKNAGAASCKDFINVFSSQGNQLNKTAYMQWISGYSTAIARMNNLIDVFPIKSSFELLQMVIFVCNEKPDELVETAVRVTIVRLKPFWVKGNAEIINLQNAGKEVKYFRASVTPLQQAIKDQGFKISVDGAYGNQTGAGISAISSANGLPKSPLPSAALLYIFTKKAPQ
jgi:hypothetical protein